MQLRINKNGSEFLVSCNSELPALSALSYAEKRIVDLLHNAGGGNPPHIDLPELPPAFSVREKRTEDNYPQYNVRFQGAKADVVPCFRSFDPFHERVYHVRF